MAAADDRVKVEIAAALSAEKEGDISEAAKKISQILPIYEDALKMLTHDLNIRVSMLTTRMNDDEVQAVSIYFSSKLSKFYNYLKTEMTEMAAYPGVKFSPLSSIIYVAIAYLSPVLAVIDGEVEKRLFLDKIDAEIIRLQVPPTFSFFIAPSDSKIDLLNDLKTKVKEAKPHQPGESLSTIVALWEQTEVRVKDPSSGAIETKTNGQLLRKPRNILSRAFFEEEETETSEFLTRLKAGPK